jgi:hypothetical protein
MDKCSVNTAQCHPEPLFFSGEGSLYPYAKRFLRLAKHALRNEGNASLQNDILRGIYQQPNLDAFALILALTLQT